MENLHIRIPSSVKRSLRQRSQALGISMSAYLLVIIDAELTRRDISATGSEEMEETALGFCLIQ
ncbi:hypothetical protein [Paracoccus nototheniae]|uniref:hypothetical protein n=1 Tax=Paracoccus nototheniae TaxID=2489002 RepID=UPI00366BFB7F